MKLGLNIGAGMLTDENFRFARQVGATHLIAHLPDEATLPSGSGCWEEEDLTRLRKRVQECGLELAGIENFRPAHWDQILLDGPGRAAQLENLKRTIRNMGRAGIPAMGYYFSLAGVWGRVQRPYARGGAMSVGYDAEEAPEETPIPHGEVWGAKLPGDHPPGNIGEITTEQMWDRLAYFIQNLAPVAEEAGVRLAAHPDDPPLHVLRGAGRLITRPEHYQRLLDLAPVHANGLEFCQGTIAEMGCDVYDAIRRYARQDRIVYVHFRNVCGTVPHYKEVFIDEGDVDMIRAMRLYHECGFDGVIVPDHTPYPECGAPWHAGMAFALGYMRATLNHLISS